MENLEWIEWQQKSISDLYASECNAPWEPLTHDPFFVPLLGLHHKMTGGLVLVQTYLKFTIEHLQIEGQGGQ